MNLELRRKQYGATGVFGLMGDLVTLEHAYPEGLGFRAKIPVGIYECIRGQHCLHGMSESFETFEVTGVPQHTGILFHWGNWNRDSEGCILLGEAQVGDMVTYSRRAFLKFMDLQRDSKAFKLTVFE